MGHQESQDKKNIDLEELTEIAQSDDIIVAQELNHDILNFLSFFNIKPGRFAFSVKGLYKVYRSWSKDPRSIKSFSMFLHDHFKFKVYGSTHNIYVSVDSLKITEALYRFLEKDKINPTKVKNYKTHVESFLTSHGLAKGDYYVPLKALYYFYDTWTYKNKNKKPLSYNQIKQFSKIYFNIKSVKQNVYIGINKNKITPTTLEQLEFAERWSNIFNEKNKKSSFKKSSK